MSDTSTGARVTLGVVGAVVLALGGVSLWVWNVFAFGIGTLAFGVVALIVAVVLLYAAVTDPAWLSARSRTGVSDAELRERRIDDHDE